MNKFLPYIASSFLIIATISVHAELRSSSTGSGVAQNTQSPVCIGIGADKTPAGCVISANSEGFGLVKTLKTKISAGTVTDTDYTNLGVTINSNVDLDDANTMAYLNEIIGALIPVGNIPTSQTPQDILLTLNAATDTNVALWIIYKTANALPSFPTSGLTNAILDDAGVSPTILTDVGTSIGLLQSEIINAISLQDASISTVNVESWITSTGGVASVIAAAADPNTDITAANVATVLTTTSTIANSYLNTGNAIHMDYLNQCISGSSDAVNDLVTCASSSNLEENLATYQIGKIVTTNSGGYASSSITTALLGQVGVPSNSHSIIGSNTCGSTGTSPCLTELRTALLASNLDETATPAQVIAKVNELMRAQMIMVVANTIIPANSVALKTGCSTSYNLPLPDPCGHAQWTCTKVQGPSNWNINQTNIVVPANSSAKGNQNVTIRMSLNVYTPAYTKDVTRTYSIQEAIAASANGYKKFSTSDNTPWTSWNACIAKGGNLATYANVINGTYTLDSHMWFAPSTEVDPNNLCCSSTNYKSWVSESETTCRKNGANGQSKRGGSGNRWTHCNGSQNSFVKTYWCKNLPSC